MHETNLTCIDVVYVQPFRRKQQTRSGAYEIPKTRLVHIHAQIPFQRKCAKGGICLKNVVSLIELALSVKLVPAFCHHIFIDVSVFKVPQIIM